MTHPVNRFHKAVTVLAGHGHIKQRLIKAYQDNLDDIDEDDLPVVIKQAFSDLRQSMYRVTPLKGESPVCASVRKMSSEDASECAAHVVALFSELSRLPEEHAVAPRQGDDEPARVPPFLVKTV